MERLSRNARGVLKPLLDEKPGELMISSRNPWTVEKIAAEFKPHGPVQPCTHIALKGFSFDLILNATHSIRRYWISARQFPSKNPGCSGAL